LKDIPALAIRGANSDLLSPAVFTRMKEELPHLLQVEVPDRGHAPQLDEPQALSAIEDFLQKLPATLPLTIRLRRQIAGAVFMAKLKAKGLA